MVAKLGACVGSVLMVGCAGVPMAKVEVSGAHAVREPGAETPATAAKALAIVPPPPALVSVTTSAPNLYATCAGEEVFVVVDVKAQEVALEQRLPMNLSLVIDRSGSMDAEHKLDHVKEAAAFLVRNLTADDVLSLVTYDDQVDVNLPAEPVSHPERFLERIHALQSGNMTNIEGGLRAGAAEVERNLDSQRINRVILLSDGLANVGVSDPRALGQLASSFAERGIAVTSMGVGVQYGEDTMMQVAELGRGNYHFIGDASQVAAVFQRELEELKAVVALDTHLELELPRGVSLQEAYGYAGVEIEGARVRIPLGDLFSGDDRRVVLRLENQAHEGALPFAARVHYRPAKTPNDEGHANSQLALTCTQDAQKLAAGENAAVREEVDLVASAALVDQAMRDVHEGRREVAKQKLEAQIQTIAKSAERSDNARLKKQVEVMQSTRHRLEALDSYAASSDEVQGFVKGNRAQSKEALKKRGSKAPNAAP